MPGILIINGPELVHMDCTRDAAMQKTGVPSKP
jgi:hypothetical protein